MGFEYKYYVDGEASYKIPAWRRTIEKLSVNIADFNYGKVNKQQNQLQPDEVALKHPSNGSFVRIKDDGAIEMFTANGNGMRVSQDSMQFFSDRMQFVGRETQFISHPNDTNINNSTFGNYPTVQEKGLSQDIINQAKQNNLNLFGLEDNNADI